MWAILSRLEEPKNAQPDACCQKIKLYNGKIPPRVYRG